MVATQEQNRPGDLMASGLFAEAYFFGEMMIVHAKLACFFEDDRRRKKVACFFEDVTCHGGIEG
jgi:hypothetical protein